ncbi:MAG: hypothetical protein HRT44_08190, partial [Bdellovibrionales bacterium]|nr:hypothetical protein [Bdellovibrionales bacterium]NQZ19218.1 hypothetical protein [Bdellovibrionales bacterium]
MSQSSLFFALKNQLQQDSSFERHEHFSIYLRHRHIFVRMTYSMIKKLPRSIKTIFCLFYGWTNSSIMPAAVEGSQTLAIYWRPCEKEAIESLVQVLDAKEKDALLKEAEDGFKERLEAFKAEKKGWEAQSYRLRGQLDKAQGLLEE